MTNSNADTPVFDHSFSTFMAGLTIGVASALLLGTKEGRRLCQTMLNSLTEHLDKQTKANPLEQIKDYTRQASENLTQQAQQVNDRTGQIAEKVQSVAQKFTNPAPPPKTPYNDFGL